MITSRSRINVYICEAGILKCFTEMIIIKSNHHHFIFASAVLMYFLFRTLICQVASN